MCRYITYSPKIIYYGKYLARNRDNLVEYIVHISTFGIGVTNVPFKYETKCIIYIDIGTLTVERYST